MPKFWFAENVLIVRDVWLFDCCNLLLIQTNTSNLFKANTKNAATFHFSKIRAWKFKKCVIKAKNFSLSNKWSPYACMYVSMYVCICVCRNVCVNEYFICVKLKLWNWMNYTKFYRTKYSANYFSDNYFPPEK